MSKLVEHIQALAHSFKSQTELDNASLAQAIDSGPWRVAGTKSPFGVGVP